MEMFIYFLIALVALVVVVKLFAWPVKMLGKLLLNGILGAVLLWLVNLFGLQIGINAATALIAGFFGVPGVIFLVVLKYIL